MSSINYTSLQGIREEAGLQHEQKLAALTGVANGSNRIFYANRTYIVDRDNNDMLSSNDVVVYVNDVAVSVSSVNGVTGAITLAAAPANGATVRGTWAYSVASDARVGEVREEAQDWLANKVKSYRPTTQFTKSDFPKTWRAVVRLWAAGLMLIRDYGKSADTDLTSKDGYEKQKTAKAMLTEWLSDVMDDSESSTPVSVSVKTDGTVFSRNTDLNGSTGEFGIDPTTDEFFHHDEF